MGYGPVVNGKQRPISSWKGSWAQQEQERKERTTYSPLHGCMVTRRADRPDLLESRRK